VHTQILSDLNIHQTSQRLLANIFSINYKLQTHDSYISVSKLTFIKISCISLLWGDQEALKCAQIHTSLQLHIKY